VQIVQDFVPRLSETAALHAFSHQFALLIGYKSDNLFLAQILWLPIGGWLSKPS
jgi:hypothetical protein